MAKKKAKKVAKKGKREVKADVTEEDQRIIEDIDSMSPEEAEEILDPAAVIKPPKQVAGSGKQVRINIPVRLKINRKFYEPGVHVVDKSLVPQLMEMIDRKRKADISIFTGKKYLVERLLDRSLVVREVDSLDQKK